MDLSRAYGTNFVPAPPLGTSIASPPTSPAADDLVPVQREERGKRRNNITGEMPELEMRQNPARAVYMINIEIGKEDAHLLCMFIAALILSLLFTSRK